MRPPSKAALFVRAIEQYQRLVGPSADPAALLHALPDHDFAMLVYTVADMFQQLKAEGLRRGTWDALKKKPLVPQEREAD